MQQKAHLLILGRSVSTDAKYTLGFKVASATLSVVDAVKTTLATQGELCQTARKAALEMFTLVHVAKEAMDSKAYEISGLLVDMAESASNISIIGTISTPSTKLGTETFTKDKALMTEKLKAVEPEMADEYSPEQWQTFWNIAEVPDAKFFPATGKTIEQFDGEQVNVHNEILVFLNSIASYSPRGQLIDLSVGNTAFEKYKAEAKKLFATALSAAKSQAGLKDLSYKEQMNVMQMTLSALTNSISSGYTYTSGKFEILPRQVGVQFLLTISAQMFLAHGTASIEEKQKGWF